MYSVEFEKRCLRELKRLEKPVVKRAFEIIEKVIAPDPSVGKALKGKYRGLFSYRFADYRIIYEIIEERVVIVVLRIRHRKDVYDGL
jgi:mRNA interferase RelE/StbE